MKVVAEKNQMIRGFAHNRSVLVGQTAVEPIEGQALTPDGFNWGVKGIATEKCAVGILYTLTADLAFSLKHSLEFKNDFLMELNNYDDFEIPVSKVVQWIKYRKEI